jgi:hypothetical protein
MRFLSVGSNERSDDGREGSALTKGASGSLTIGNVSVTPVMEIAISLDGIGDDFQWAI